MSEEPKDYESVKKAIEPYLPEIMKLKGICSICGYKYLNLILHNKLAHGINKPNLNKWQKKLRIECIRFANAVLGATGLIQSGEITPNSKGIEEVVENFTGYMSSFISSTVIPMVRKEIAKKISFKYGQLISEGVSIENLDKFERFIDNLDKSK